jgi:hypothetical protein
LFCGWPDIDGAFRRRFGLLGWTVCAEKRTLRLGHSFLGFFACRNMPFGAFYQTSYMRVPFQISMVLAGLFALFFWVAVTIAKSLPTSINSYLPGA